MNNLLTPIFNRDGHLPADHWFHLVPRGEYPHPDTGKIQVIDDTALAAMKNSFHPKVLVDQEHWSYDLDKSSEAFGWIEAVDVRADGLWGKVELSDLGTAAIANKRYRFLSPVWLPRDAQAIDGKKIRPLRLDSAGLTNSPNLRGMVPLSNRRSESAADNQNNQPRTSTMKTIATKLGLSAEASEDAILAAVTGIISNRDDLTRQLKETEPFKNRITELETQVGTLTDEQIDQDLDASAIKDEAKRTALKPVLKPMKNREARQAFIKTCVTADGKPANTPITNRASAKTPADNKTTAPRGDEQALVQQQSEEVNDYRIANRCSYEVAREAIRRKKPELFGLAARN